jgi:hypothetical protein
MRVKNPVIVHSSYEQHSVRTRFMGGVTATLWRAGAARWAFSGGMLVNPELVGSR